ncbi:LuxR C-terminal-related transcriptional regulator [Bosea sp. 2RAB26]|uniref:LuxR C-terminal-related transcriptional regulator n=1 Tax=Bosea sp. 2RAB26 TaxID=3237476 RepID=UPI003F9002C6
MPDRSVAIVDDHPLLMEGIGALLKRWGGFALTATGNIAEDIVSIVRTHRPGEMIVDLNMVGDVFQAIADALKIAAETNIIVFTASTSPDDAIRALDAGARGYVLKGSPGEDLFQALQAAQHGDVYVTPAFATKVIGALQDKAVERQKAISNRLSVREEQIVKLLLLGKRNSEIARELSLSDKTIKGYMTNLMAKLNVRNRLEVVLAAQRLYPPMTIATVTRLHS